MTTGEIPLETLPTGQPATRAFWLAGRGADLALLIATPVLLIPVFTLAQRWWSDAAIVIAVTLFGANAHHLPGLMRAYGDPQFRHQYRWRLTIAPLAIASVSLGFFHLELNGLLFVAFVWGIWHALAQVYGLGRMYDARASLISPRTAHLDKALCIGWFFGGFLFSPHRMSIVLTELYQTGLPALAPEALSGFRMLWMLGTAGITAAWVWNQSRLWRAGLGNSIKLVLFASSIAFWWYSNIPIESAIVGVVLFEAFHDIQYLTTVWLYNERVVQKNQRLGAFSRVLFRPGLIGIALYIGFCWLYGSAGVIGKSILGDGATTSIAALVLTSLLLHFYYDSFLWNVREQSVRDDFDLQSGAPDPAPIGPTRGFSLRLPGLAWAWFVIPLVVLLGVQLSMPGGLASEWRAKLAYTLPNNEKALLGLGASLFEEGRDDEAVALIERAAALDPTSVEALRRLVEAYARGNRRGDADLAFERLEDLEGVDARSLVSLGVLHHDSDPARAQRDYLRSLELDPANIEARVNLASLMAQRGELEPARIQLLAAREIEPRHPAIAYNLGAIEAQLGNYDAAVRAFADALALQPDHPDARRALQQAQRRTRGLRGATPQ